MTHSASGPLPAFPILNPVSLVIDIGSMIGAEPKIAVRSTLFDGVSGSAGEGVVLGDETFWPARCATKRRSSPMPSDDRPGRSKT